MISVNPRENLEQQTKVLVGRRIGQRINSQPLGRIVALAKRDLFLFLRASTPEYAFRSSRIQPFTLAEPTSWPTAADPEGCPAPSPADRKYRHRLRD
jgi:hypothetical protein